PKVDRPLWQHLTPARLHCFAAESFDGIGRRAGISSGELHPIHTRSSFRRSCSSRRRLPGWSKNFPHFSNNSLHCNRWLSPGNQTSYGRGGGLAIIIERSG